MAIRRGEAGGGWPHAAVGTAEITLEWESSNGSVRFRIGSEARHGHNSRLRRGTGSHPCSTYLKQFALPAAGASEAERHAQEVQLRARTRRPQPLRSEEHTSELQSLRHLVCR